MIRNLPGKCAAAETEDGSRKSFSQKNVPRSRGARLQLFNEASSADLILIRRLPPTLVVLCVRWCVARKLQPSGWQLKFRLPSLTARS
jgi:hypothetical protein